LNVKTVFRIVLAALLLSVVIAPAWAAFGTAGTVLPQLLDGSSYRTIVYIQNLNSTTTETYRLNMMNEDSTPALFHFAEVSGVTESLSGTLQPMAVVSFHTNGGADGPAGPQIGWANLDFTGFPANTGMHIAVWEVIESADPTGKWTTQSSILSVPILIADATPAGVLFDQTNGVACGVAIVNLLPTTANITAIFYGSNGAPFAYYRFTLPPLNHVQYLLGNVSALSNGIAGTVMFYPTNSADVLSLSIMGIRGTKYAVGWTQTSLPVVGN
jgi:hypothetical protein